MATRKLTKAQSRPDYSHYLVHLSKGLTCEGMFYEPKKVLWNILTEGQVRPSVTTSITQYDPTGAACFYDVPPMMWQALVSTNPNNRQGYGLIVHKEAFWLAGGRPVIYTEHPTNRPWPVEEKYRLVRTDPLSETNPADWMHEKEWRIRGPLILNQPAIAARAPLAWWWPCVALDLDVWEVWNKFPSISYVYSLEKGITYARPAPTSHGG